MKEPGLDYIVHFCSGNTLHISSGNMFSYHSDSNAPYVITENNGRRYIISRRNVDFIEERPKENIML